MSLDVTYSCPECGEINRTDYQVGAESFACGACQQTLRLARRTVNGENIQQCLVCPSEELFVRKDFPQRLGVLIVSIGFAASCVAWYYHMLITTYAILFATALIDVALYFLVRDLLECYLCHAQYRGSGDLEQHEAFDLEIHERHRQTQARLKQAAQQVSSPKQSSNSANTD